MHCSGEKTEKCTATASRRAAEGGACKKTHEKRTPIEGQTIGRTPKRNDTYSTETPDCGHDTQSEGRPIERQKSTPYRCQGRIWRKTNLELDR